MQTPPGSRQLQHYISFGGYHWRTGGLLVGRTSSIAPDCSICLEDELSRFKLYTDSWAMANSFARWSEIWKEHDWKIGDMEVWRRDMWISLSEWVKHMKILYPLWILNKRVTSTEEHINNQLDRMNCSADTSQLFLHEILLLPNGLVNITIEAKTEVMLGLSNMNFQWL